MKLGFLKAAARAASADYYAYALKALFTGIGLSLRYGVSVELLKRRCGPDEVALDIVIPVIDKDADTLPAVILSARKEIVHRIGRIFLVAPASSLAIRGIAEELDCVFVDEATLLPISKGDIDYSFRAADRSGWLYQQLLKWACDTITLGENYLVLDSDTVLVYPHCFVGGDRQYYDFSDERHLPYLKAISSLLGFRPRCPVSFVSHHGLINRAYLAELKGELEKRSGKTWYEAILGGIDRNEECSFSEYETYGQFVFERHREKLRLRYWHNKSFPRERIADLEGLRESYAGKYRSLSFHAWR